MARGGSLRERVSESKRQARVSQLLRSELADILLKGYEIKSSDVLPDEVRKLVSILDVAVAGDIRSANVFVTVQGDAFEKRKAFSWLVKNTKSIRHALAQRLREMKGVPELYFYQSDVSAAVDLMHLIDQVSKGNAPPPDFPFPSSTTETL